MQFLRESVLILAEPRQHAKCVAHPCDETSLRGAVEAAKEKFIKPILVGPETCSMLLCIEASRHG